MEIKVTYSDYSDKVKSAEIEIDVDKVVGVGYSTEDIQMDVVQPDGSIIQETVTIDKLDIVHSDVTLSMEIANSMSREEALKYIALLQRFVKQMKSVK